MLILKNFNSFAIAYLSRLLQKFTMEVVLNSLQTQKGLELVFKSHFLQNFFDKIIPIVI